MSRGKFLNLGLVAGAGLVLPLSTSACSFRSSEGSAGSLLRSQARLPQPFQVSLPVPPVLKPVRSDTDADYYEMTQKIEKADILTGLKAEVRGYEGIFPGPTIESRSGRRIVVRQINELPVPVSTYLHGVHTPPESDCFPTDLILPEAYPSPAGHGHSGETKGSFHEGSKEYSYPLEQRPRRCGTTTTA
jgi:spore coat protein A, manganese oxidase